MPNKILANILTTDNRTPIVAEWLIGQLNSLAEAAPPDALERTSMRPLATEAAYKTYRENRSKDNPQRVACHEALCRQTRTALQNLFSLLNKQGEVAMPTTVQYLEGRIRNFIEIGKWSRKCSRCGKNASSLTVVEKSSFCKDCLDTYTQYCNKCSGRFLYEHLINVSVRGRDYAFYCESCAPHDRKHCQRCRNYFTGKAGDGKNCTAEEIKAETGFELCNRCAGGAVRGNCGHICTDGGRPVRMIQNVEDDNRHRDDPLGQTNEIFCNKCLQAADFKPQNWNVKKPKVSSKTHGSVGSQRAYGVELEICQAKKMPGIDNKIKECWTAKRDASLPEFGVEMASTILQGDDGLVVIKNLLDYAIENDWRIDTRAGFHLHLDMNKESAAQVDAVAMGYLITRPLWMNFVTPNRGKSKYCVAHSMSPKEALKHSQREGDVLYRLTNRPGGGADADGPFSRRTWVNWHSYLARRTVEIRVHQGTLNYTKVKNWITAHAKFVDWCSKRPAKDVYEAMNDIDVRDLFLFVTQEIWKDRELGAWFRERAKTLHGAKATLRESNRKLRKAGLDPKALPPVEADLDGSRAGRYAGNVFYLVTGPLFNGRWGLCSNQRGGVNSSGMYIGGGGDPVSRYAATFEGPETAMDFFRACLDGTGQSFYEENGGEESDTAATRREPVVNHWHRIMRAAPNIEIAFQRGPNPADIWVDNPVPIEPAEEPEEV